MSSNVYLFLPKTKTHRPVCLPEGSGSVKSGGGGNAREFRIRKTKKKGRKDEDSDEETGPSQQSTVP